MVIHVIHMPFRRDVLLITAQFQKDCESLRMILPMQTAELYLQYLAAHINHFNLQMT